MIPEIKSIPYHDRLCFFSLETELFQIDLIQIRSMIDIDFGKYFTKIQCKSIREDPLNIQTLSYRLNMSCCIGASLSRFGQSMPNLSTSSKKKIQVHVAYIGKW